MDEEDFTSSPCFFPPDEAGQGKNRVLLVTSRSRRGGNLEGLEKGPVLDLSVASVDHPKTGLPRKGEGYWAIKELGKASIKFFNFHKKFR